MVKHSNQIKNKNGCGEDDSHPKKPVDRIVGDCVNTVGKKERIKWNVKFSLAHGLQMTYNGIRS